MNTTSTLPKVSVILPAYNEEKYIEQALNSIKNQNYDKNLVEILVVDNNSSDSTQSIAEKLSTRVELLIDGPVGKVRNRGAHLAQGDILFFLDADCIAPPNWLSHAVENISRNPKLVLGGGYELRSEPKTIEKYWLLDGPQGHILPKDLLGGCIALTKDVFFSIGGFDEKVTSGEDSKLSQNLKKAGYKVKIEREMSVIHLGNPTTAKAFLVRQIWHSENYLRNPKDTFNDITFILTLTFTFAIIALPITAITNKPRLATLMTLIIFTLPLIFSLKRIMRSKNLKNLSKLHKIYFLDFLYLVGRSLGLSKSIIQLFKKTK